MTNWEAIFGTPEKAANELALICDFMSKSHSPCPLHFLCMCKGNECMLGVHEGTTWLEWLQEEAS